MTLLISLYLTFSCAHAWLISCCLRKMKAPLLAYAFSIPLWFFTWPFMSLSALNHALGIAGESE